ncbi:hypothetical protein WL05_29770 [Burkholderia ubonensis]|uniref:DUF1493 family protein n=1 Tax=Burkholderia ubonensis TaxID=101571 RepID=UPI00075CE707|nr:DUF1493 family protein [Burkholderia ubonensis]KVM11219.1 hypothetical protein WJ52_22500 [Burkholderia ubonensis]KVM14658.1 hypothetical protein WJ51_13270 [Burkholderia ubonensis]KVM50428.1 hypothetical protein WJ56_14120 [Burkholderia ubonensis]KVO18950.1 hypothetical protein WJ72_06935 [Burkholderia ubonensis]KVX62194.1 hypothetical protein WL05_29770 [Burkholderia ubonensis]
MVDLESRVIEFVRKKSGLSILSRAADITENTDLDADLDFDAAEVEEMMLEYSAEFNVDVSGFDIKKYYPEDDFSFLDLINPFKKKVIHRVPDLNVRMLIISAKAGRWLYG